MNLYFYKYKMSHSRRQVWLQKAPINRWEAMVTVIAQALWVDVAATFPVSHNVCLEICGTNEFLPLPSYSILYHQGFGSFFSFLEDFSVSLSTSGLTVHGRVCLPFSWMLSSTQRWGYKVQFPPTSHLQLDMCLCCGIPWSHLCSKHGWIIRWCDWEHLPATCARFTKPSYWISVSPDFRQLWTATLKTSLPIVL